MAENPGIAALGEHESARLGELKAEMVIEAPSSLCMVVAIGLLGGLFKASDLAWKRGAHTATFNIDRSPSNEPSCGCFSDLSSSADRRRRR